MFENVSIIIPFQNDYGPRLEAFLWVKKFFETTMPSAEMIVGRTKVSRFNKAKAVNLAAKEATRDILLIVDADTVFDPNIILESIKLLQYAAWVIPFKEVYDVPMDVTEKVMRTKPGWPLNVKLEDCHKVNWMYDGFAGKVNLIPKRNFEKVGGFDERFIGWGGEDDAFAWSVNTLCGNFVNYDAKVFHLWHPPANNPDSRGNDALVARYMFANGNQEEMLKIIRER
ncbi:galactosyltransferase-related protein [Neobacillus drentensis]|uniref:galactosyltransferase-related protein n=1 Tax=Neobacillus drentensis TaxID=220684 RepID=UPI002FFFCE93